MKRILVIPHHPVGESLKIRLGEIAKFLSLSNEVYLLNWTAPRKKYTVLNRVIVCLQDLFKIPRLYAWGELKVIELPILHRPLGLVCGFNSFWLNRFLRQKKIDLVINGSYYMFNISKEKSPYYVLDLADIPSEGDDNFSRFIHEVVNEEAQKADIITVVSNTLGDYVKDKYNKESVFVPNGFDSKKMGQVTKNQIEKIRCKYNLQSKWVIGYIGYIGNWVAVETVCNAFKLIKKKISNAHLLWVGAAPDIEMLRNQFGNEDITFTAGISDDIEPFFKMIDLGILPHNRCLFQDCAFHIKLIEYTAAKKMVVSSAIKEVVRLNLPNVKTPQLKAQLWAEAIIDVKSKSWDSQWNTLVSEYDWTAVGEMFTNLMDKS